jgi:pre-mRNA-splicing factor CWC22
MERMKAEFEKEEMREYFEGLFPIDHPNNLRFAINYFTSIGLGALT